MHTKRGFFRSNLAALREHPNCFIKVFALISLHSGVHVLPDLFDSMPEASGNKADPATSVALFTAGTLSHLLCALALISCLAVPVPDFV